MVHEVAAMVHLILLIGTVAIMVQDASPKVFVRIGSLLPIFPIVISGPRVLRNDRQLEVLVPHHTVVSVAVEHRVVSAEVRRHWKLWLVVVHQVVVALLLNTGHVASLLPGVLLLLGLVRPTGGLSDHGVGSNLVNSSCLLIGLEQLLSDVAVLQLLNFHAGEFLRI